SAAKNTHAVQPHAFGDAKCPATNHSGYRSAMAGTIVAVLPVPRHEISVESGTISGAISIGPLTVREIDAAVENVCIHTRAVLHVRKVVRGVKVGALVYAVEVPIGRGFRFVNGSLSVFFD